MKYLKQFSLFLALMLFLASLSLTGCSETAKKPPAESGSSDPESAGETETEKDPGQDDVPELDFGNTVFRVCSSGDQSGMIRKGFDFEERGSDRVDNAIYERNRRIEDRFHIYFEETPVSYNEAYRTLVNAQHEFDMIEVLDRNAITAATTHTIRWVDELPYINPDKPYYLSEANKQLTINGKLMFAFSSECLNSYELTTCLVFNKDLAAAYELDSLYEAVGDRTWTYEAMYEDAMKVSSKLNTEQPWWDETDRYGVVGVPSHVFPNFWVSSDIVTVDKDSEGWLTYSAVGNSKLYDMLRTTIGYVKTEGFWYSTGNYSQDVKMFREGNALFAGIPLGYLKHLLSMESYGVLPFPLYNSEQDHYVSRMSGAWVYVVPAIVTDTERVSAVMEVLAAETYNSVMPEYYDNALKSRYIRDAESRDMMELIFNTRTMDLGDPIFMTVRNTILTLYTSAGGEDSIVSTISGLESTIQGTLDAANDAVRDPGSPGS